MDPIEQTSKPKQEEVSSPILTPEPPVVEIAPRGGVGRFYLLQYVAMLVSGLILVSLMTLTGFALVDQWLAKPKTGMAIFSDFSYYYYLYLLVSMVLFGGLHIWLRVRTAGVNEADQPSAARGFLAVFLAILAISIVGALGAVAYIGVDTMLGTGNYSSSDVWMVILDALLVVVLSGFSWWHFKYSVAAKLYAAVVTGLVIVATVLLVVFPVMARRDAVIDSRTSNDLSVIERAVGDYVKKNSKLPANLREVELDDKVASRLSTYEYEAKESSSETSPTSRQNDLYYGYGRSSGKEFSYKLCATFKTDTNKEDEDKDNNFLSMVYGGYNKAKHPSGRHCFDEKAYAAGNSDDGASTSPAEPSIDELLNSGMSF